MFLFCFHAPSTHRGGYNHYFEHCLYHGVPLHRRRTCTAVLNNRLDLLMLLAKPNLHHVKTKS